MAVGQKFAKKINLFQVLDTQISARKFKVIVKKNLGLFSGKNKNFAKHQLFLFSQNIHVLKIFKLHGIVLPTFCAYPGKAI